MARVFNTSDETREVINGHAKEMAEAYGCNRSYYDAIVSDHETDGFEKFRRSLYLPALLAGRSVAPWITRLKLDQEKYQALSEHRCVKQATIDFAREADDVPVTHMEEKTLEAQLAEVQQANAKGADLERALIHAIITRDGGSVREFAKAKVRARG